MRPQPARTAPCSQSETTPAPHPDLVRRQTQANLIGYTYNGLACLSSRIMLLFGLTLIYTRRGLIYMQLWRRLLRVKAIWIYFAWICRLCLHHGYSQRFANILRCQYATLQSYFIPMVGLPSRLHLQSSFPITTHLLIAKPGTNV
jgi:hypothetical protein